MKRILLFLLFASGLAFGQRFASLDDISTGWTVYLDPAGSGTATATPLTTGNPSPARDSASMLLSLSGNAHTNVGWFRNMGINNSNTTFILDQWVQTASLANMTALEYDQGQYLLAGDGGVTQNTRVFWGTECVMGGGWDIWDSYIATGISAHWVHTGVPCTFSASQWHRLTIMVHRVTGDTSGSGGYPLQHYDAIILDGVTVVSNLTTSGGPLPVGWGEQTVFMLQMDTNTACGASCTVSESFDLLNYTMAPSAPSSIGPFLGDNAYCGAGDVPNFPTDGPSIQLLSCNYTARLASPSTGTTRVVNTAADLTAALTAAVCGDNIVLTAGITVQGNFTLPAKACDSAHWITIKTSAMANFPPEGTRVSPCYFGVGSLPGRPNFNCASTIKYGATIISLGRGNTHPLSLSAGVHYLRIEGIEFAPDPTGVFGDTPVRGLLDTSKGNLDHLILDQVWMHGLPSTEVEYVATLSTPGNTAPTTNISAIDSFFTDIHCVSGTGQCTDNYIFNYGVSNAADGVFKIVNNFIEAAGEGLFSGGAAATTVPFDVEVRLNYFFKPQTWNKSSLSYNGGVSGNPFVVKNIIENKNVTREFIEGNFLQNSWSGFSQFGQAIDLTPKNYLGTCPNCEVTNVIIRYNAGNNVALTYQIANTYANPGQYSLRGNSFSIHDNLWDDILDPLTCGSNTPTSCAANLAAMTQLEGTNSANTVSTNIMHDVLLNHETMIMSASPIGQPPAAFYVDGPNGAVQSNLKITNSIMAAGTFGITGVYSGVGTHCGYNQSMSNLTAWLNLCWTNWTLTNNAIVGAIHSGWVWPSNGGVVFPANYSALGFVSYNGGNGGDYRLCTAASLPAVGCLASSVYHNAGTDALDIGANLALLKPLTNFATGTSGPVPTPVHVSPSSILLAFSH